MTENLNIHPKHGDVVVIIGSGISGLAAGIYAQRSGFKTTILEQHVTPGGLCCSWSRKGYTFEGGMHWLTGSSPKMPLNKVWREVGALQDNNPIVCRELVYELMALPKKDGAENTPKDTLAIYRDVEKMRQVMLAWSPQDKKVINQLCHDIKRFRPVHFIVNDIPFLKSNHHTHPGLLELLGCSIALPTFLHLVGVSLTSYISRFKSKEIRQLLSSVVGYRYNAMSMMFTLASFANGDCGTPMGGSTLMVNNMVALYQKLGGTIKYRSKVSSVEIQDKQVKGVIVAKEFIPCDHVVITQDAWAAVATLFPQGNLFPLNQKRVSALKKSFIPELNTFVSIGAKQSFVDKPRVVVLPIENSFVAGGCVYTELRVNVYPSPKGTIFTCILLGDSYDYWTKAKASGTYNALKDELGKSLVATLDLFFPGVLQAMEVFDVATPLTYERYCSSYHGSWMSVWSAASFIHPVPIKVKSVHGLYFAGQRTIVPGGLPCAVASGRTAAQYLCRDNDVEFISSDV